MLQSQVNYWNLQETKRHNLATEAYEKQRTDYQGISANASMMQAETQRQLMPAEFAKAQASVMQAEAAKENVQVNWANAYTNARNADTNERNADINAYNAETNRINAGINQMNANTNLLGAQTGWYSMIGNLVNTTMNTQANISKIETENLLTEQKTATESQKTAQEEINTKFTTANNIMELGATGAHAFRDVGDTIAQFWKQNKQDEQRNDSNILNAFISLLPYVF